MTRDDIHKLLGGYATGTLTPEEQQALFAAALDDQELFDALAKEQALHDLLRDPTARAHVLAAIDERPEPWWQRAGRWMLRPAYAGALTVCLAAVVGYGVWHARQTRTAAPTPVLVAENRQQPPAPATPVPPPAAEPAPAEKPTPPVGAVRQVTSPKTETLGTLAPPKPPVLRDAKDADEVKKAVVAPVVQAETNQAANNQVAGARAFQSQAPMNQAAPAPAPLSQQNVAPSQQQTVTGSAEAVAVQKAAPLPAPAPMMALPMSTAMKSEFRADDAASSFGAYGQTSPLVKWSALRREPDGRLSPVAADQIHAGDAIVLRLEPLEDGQLSVVEAVAGRATPRVVMPGTQVQMAKTVDTPSVTLDHAGDQVLLVQFTRPAGGGGRGGASAGLGGTRMAKSQPVAAKEKADSPAPETITLHYR